MSNNAEGSEMNFQCSVSETRYKFKNSQGLPVLTDFFLFEKDLVV